MMDSDLLVAAGVDPSGPVALQAAGLVARLPMRRQPPAGSRDAASVVESRWFAGVAECHRVLGQLFRGSSGRGTCLGGTWPYLEAAGNLVAPAVPVVVGGAEEEGPDGCYELSDGVVWREAAGERRAFVRLDGGDGPVGEGFDLLWFGVAERYLLCAGELEVEDLFSVLRLSPSRTQIERRIVRAQRLDEEVLDGVEFTGSGRPPELEVRRPAVLADADRWRDPAEVVGARADIASARRRGDEVLARTQADRAVEFRIEEDRDGWRLLAWNGDYPYRALDLHRRRQHLCLTATLNDGIDPLAPGVRNQLAFDLRSNLVALD